MEIWLSVALLVAAVLLAVAAGVRFRRSTGRVLPYGLAVAAGVVAVFAVASAVLLVVVSTS